MRSDSDGQRTSAGLDRQFVRADGHRDGRHDRDNKIAAVRIERGHGPGPGRFDRERANSRVLGDERQVLRIVIFYLFYFFIKSRNETKRTNHYRVSLVES